MGEESGLDCLEWAISWQYCHIHSRGGGGGGVPGRSGGRGGLSHTPDESLGRCVSEL